VSRIARARLGRYLLRRLAFAAALVFLVSSGALLIARLAPGDLTAEHYGEGSTGASAAERTRAGLDRSLPAFYADWLSRAVRLDFGVSWRYGRPVGALVAERAANTAILAALALLLATAAGVSLGVVSGTGRGTVARAIAGASVLALSVPPLVLSLALAWLAARTGWFPVGGMWSAPAFSSAEAFARAASHLVLPVLALAVPVGATLERVQSRAIRRAMAEVSIAAARARGVDEGRLRWRHGLRLSLAPLASVYGLVAAGLFSGSFAVEVVTAWPGLGRLMYDALLSRDVVLVAGCAAGGALLVAASTLLSDAALAWADPRVGDAT
jgi:peptide/nickel transport system permease protein